MEIPGQTSIMCWAPSRNAQNQKCTKPIISDKLNQKLIQLEKNYRAQYWSDYFFDLFRIDKINKTPFNTAMEDFEDDFDEVDNFEEEEEDEFEADFEDEYDLDEDSELDSIVDFDDEDEEIEDVEDFDEDEFEDDLD